MRSSRQKHTRAGVRQAPVVVYGGELHIEGWGDPREGNIGEEGEASSDDKFQEAASKGGCQWPPRGAAEGFHGGDVANDVCETMGHQKPCTDLNQ